MIPTMEEANDNLKKAEVMNPGRWIEHSQNVAKASFLIAKNMKGMDENKAYILGLLHDIGRRVGFIGKRHIWEGYQYAMQMGWDEVARICLTHSFPVKDIDIDISKDDLNNEEREYIREFLCGISYDEYDKLIILCDSLADYYGYCFLEKRFVDTTIRYGVYPFTVERWKKTFEIKEYFDVAIGKNIYTLLDGIDRCIFF